MPKRKSSELSQDSNPVAGKAIMFACPYQSGTSSNKLKASVLSSRVQYESLNRDTQFYFVATTNVHALPAKCSGVLVALCCNLVTDKNQNTMTTNSWILGMIIKHDAWNTAVIEIFPVRGQNMVRFL